MPISLNFIVAPLVITLQVFPYLNVTFGVYFKSQLDEGNYKKFCEAKGVQKGSHLDRSINALNLLVLLYFIFVLSFFLTSWTSQFY
ncbi:hypothetical protein RIF29_17603 [Crotalaria pallida]|uniref:Uncharacterized protein n=1 Tax=Crotalaria pallida TaxID=3830 RepID=A0AAN9FHL4_CROPI